MHNALSFQRVHQPKGSTTAVYHPETNMAYVHNPKGVHFTKMGQVMSAKDDPLGNDEWRGQRLWLLPEEMLYLLERGSMDVRWPSLNDEGDSMGLPMSLQGAYAILIGDEDARAGALTLERYSVYSGLKRMGYTVLRASSWDSQGPPMRSDSFPPIAPQRTWQAGLLSSTHWWKSLFANTTQDYNAQQQLGPLVAPNLYRSYAEIYRRLAIIDHYDPACCTLPVEPSLPLTDPCFRITYDVWKPGSQTYKKSAPGPPDFRIAVINARETAVPTLEQLSSLFESAPYHPPPENAQLYQKLKHGYKNTILAVVDQGVVSYLRVADAAFGREKLYERKSRLPAGKRGGRGGRGRGR